MRSFFIKFKDTLNKIDQSRLDKILGFYGNDIRPRKIKAVGEAINNLKISPKTKKRFEELHDSVQEIIFTDLGFLRQLGNFSIGDKVYSDSHRDKMEIIEFIQNGAGDSAILYGETLSWKEAVPIHTLHFDRREQKGEKSHFLSLLKEKSWIENLQKTEITSDLGFFLSYYANSDYDFNPVYQRDLEWSLEQKQAFILALLTGKTDLRPILLDIPYNNRKGYHWEILDGKQRMNAVIDFVNNEFSVDNYYYKNLSAEDTQIFLNVPMIYTNIRYYGEQGWQEMSLEQKVELFLQVNDYGKRVSDEYLAKIKKKFL